MFHSFKSVHDASLVNLQIIILHGHFKRFKCSLKELNDVALRKCFLGHSLLLAHKFKVRLFLDQVCSHPDVVEILHGNFHQQRLYNLFVAAQYFLPLLFTNEIAFEIRLCRINKLRLLIKSCLKCPNNNSLGIFL